jgi:hypothetical protein
MRATYPDDPRLVRAQREAAAAIGIVSTRATTPGPS